MPHGIQTKRLKRPQARLLAGAALLSGVLMAGCGGSSPGPTVAGLSATTTSESTAASAGAAAGAEQPSPSSLGSDALAYAKCMRSNGVPSFPDPNAGGGFLFHARTGVINSPLFKAAQAKCHKLLPEGPGSGPPPSPQTLARFLKIARCMRQHGVSDFPDPRTSAPPNPLGSGIAVLSDIEGVILLFPSTINQQSPVFTRAAAVCAFPLHNH
jgi:hypothetical protein